jgi:hypothetical protein
MFISALGSSSIAAEFVGAPQPLHLDKVGTPIAQSGHAYTASGAPFARVSSDMAARRTVNLANARKAAQTVLPTVVLAVMPNAVQAGQDSLQRLSLCSGHFCCIGCGHFCPQKSS